MYFVKNGCDGEEDRQRDEYFCGASKVTSKPLEQFLLFLAIVRRNLCEVCAQLFSYSGAGRDIKLDFVLSSFDLKHCMCWLNKESLY